MNADRQLPQYPTLTWPLLPRNCSSCVHATLTVRGCFWSEDQEEEMGG